MDKVLSKVNFTDIYDKYIDKIYRFIFLKVNSREIAQDLSSETFTRAFEYSNRNKDKEIGNFQAFLFRTAMNLVTDYYREKFRQNISLDGANKFFAETIASRDVHLETSAAGGEQLQKIITALKGMEGELGNVIMWHFVEDISIREIAKMSGRPEGTIRVMLHRGLKALRNILESHPS